MNIFEQQSNEFQQRHIGPNSEDLLSMLKTIGVNELETLISQTVPDNIRIKQPLNIPDAISEFEYLSRLKSVAAKNKVYKNFIGQGYYGTITPSVILRNNFGLIGRIRDGTPSIRPIRPKFLKVD